jgi:L-serine deaminase
MRRTECSNWSLAVIGSAIAMTAAGIALVIPGIVQTAL